MDDLHGIWRREGAAATSDDPSFDDVVPALARHLAPAVLAFDEASPIPLPQSDGTGHGLVRFVTHLQQLLVERDEQLAERVSAVALRDTIIEELRRDQETVMQRLRRKLANGK